MTATSLLGTGCSSWQTPDLLHQQHPHCTAVLAKGTAVQLGGLHPALRHNSPGPSPLPRAGTGQDLQRVLCNDYVSETYVFKSSRC